MRFRVTLTSYVSEFEFGNKVIVELQIRCFEYESLDVLMSKARKVRKQILYSQVGGGDRT